jgi:hypothetical protein
LLKVGSAIAKRDLATDRPATTPAIEATATSETLTFRGKSYAQKQYTAAMRQPTEELTYRGIRYTA